MSEWETWGWVRSSYPTTTTTSAARRAACALRPGHGYHHGNEGKPLGNSCAPSKRSRYSARGWSPNEAVTSPCFRTSDDDVFAIHDKCPHKGGPLSQGIVHGRSVTCRCTTGRSASGRQREAPTSGCSRSFAAKVENGTVSCSSERTATPELRRACRPPCDQGAEGGVRPEPRFLILG